MPSLLAEGHGVQAVSSFRKFLDELLARAREVKPATSVEPALDKSDFQDLTRRIGDALPGYEAKIHGDNDDSKKGQRFAIIETAVRDVFTELIATTSIESPDFVRVWNLLDIVSILANGEQCDAALMFWLVEELLDGQTIYGCRKVFEFLEARRERMTAKLHTQSFQSQKLVILRSCNELLRRLSRAEDAAFCGRIFIYMFQSFPLGDRSSVNLRGEYHVENVTIYDEEPVEDEKFEKMDVDGQNGQARQKSEPKISKGVSFDGKKSDKPPALTPDALYPIFWSLQTSFSQPKRLFDTALLAEFKTGLEATMETFRTVASLQGSRSKAEKEKAEKQIEGTRRNLKRKREEDVDIDDLANGFNPKYLTSRDLFELEISDLSFRRHILVQALITMDFLLSLSAKSKDRLASIRAPNKSVMYSDQVLSEKDYEWAAKMKKMIASYLKEAPEGAYFYRMVETVLSRDKNWVRWKSEGCPSIEIPAVTPESYNEAKLVTKKLATNKRLRPTPMGSLSLGFLNDEARDVMEKYKSADRHKLPELASFKRKIADDDFEIEMPTNNQTKAAAIESKASKSWRALRIASRFKLASFDKIDNPDKIDFIFEEGSTQEVEEKADANDEMCQLPEDQRPIVLVKSTRSGEAGSSSSTGRTFLEKHTKVFGRVTSHIVREPRDGEQNGIDFHFVDKQAFNMLRDGDQFLEFSDNETAENHGISRSSVEAIRNSGKIPVLEVDRKGAKQLRDNEYSARFVFVTAPLAEVTEAQLKERGLSDEEIQETRVADTEDAEHSNSEGFYDLVLPSNADNAVAELERFTFGSATNQANGEPTPNNNPEPSKGQADS